MSSELKSELLKFGDFFGSKSPLFECFIAPKEFFSFRVLKLSFIDHFGIGSYSFYLTEKETESITFSAFELFF